mgnify:FL=1
MINKILITIIFFITTNSIKSAEKIELINQNWPFHGFFGRFDQSSLQRGFKVYREVCAGCHGIKHISYRDLNSIGLTKDEIKSLAAEYEIKDGPNDEGDMYMRLSLIHI